MYGPGSAHPSKARAKVQEGLTAHKEGQCPQRKTVFAAGAAPSYHWAAHIRKAACEAIEKVHDDIESAGVAVVSGSSYGSSPYFRISIATSLQVIEAACERMRDAVAALRA